MDSFPGDVFSDSFFVEIFVARSIFEARSLRRRCSVASMNISRVIYVGMGRASMGGTRMLLFLGLGGCECIDHDWSTYPPLTYPPQK